MNENDEKIEVEVEASGVGAPLKSARIAAEFTIAQVASRMNLDVDIIISIEEDEFKTHLSPAFYRGYLRTYANLMSLSAEDIIEKYNTLIQEDSLTSHITPTFENNNVVAYFNEKKSSWFKYIIITSIILLVLAASYFIYKQFAQAESPSMNSEQAEQGLLSDDSSSEGSIALDIADDASEINSAEAVKSIDKQSTKNSETSSQPLSSSNLSTGKSGSEVAQISSKVVQLQMDFSGDCWVKVTDATGEVLALGIKRSGKSMLLEGKTPFKVILGNARVVEIKLNDEPVDLSAYSSGQRVELSLSTEN